MNHKEAANHPYRGPGYCKRCGCAEFVHPHAPHTCRPETCGGINYDPCDWAVSSR